jgi:hypothetical protein
METDKDVSKASRHLEIYVKAINICLPNAIMKFLRSTVLSSEKNSSRKKLGKDFVSLRKLDLCSFRGQKPPRITSQTTFKARWC